MQKKCLNFDSKSPDGTFTVPSNDDIDMLALREYCKTNGIDFGKLTDEEIRQFKRKMKKVN